VRVALIVPGGVDRTGTERVIPIILAQMERIARVHELHVVALHQEPAPGTWPLLGATVHNVGAGAGALRGAAAVLRLHRRHPFDVLHAMWATPGLAAVLAGRVIRRPILLHLAGGEMARLPEIGYGGQRRLRDRLTLRAAVAGAARVTVPGAYMRDAAARLGIAATVLPWGVDLARWPVRAPRERREGETARLLFAGSLNRVKDPETVIACAARLRDAAVDFRLDVAGMDVRGGEIHRLVAEAGLGDRVRFHGVVAFSALRPLMEAADLLLVSSLHEAGPMVAVEAALCGVPTVGTPVGFLAEWAPDAAVTVPRRDPAAMAAAVAALLADEPRRLALAAAAQARAREMDADRTADAHLEAYDALVRSP
jgi:glycosyltransferase involved in cell wall biosynthesis